MLCIRPVSGRFYNYKSHKRLIFLSDYNISFNYAPYVSKCYSKPVTIQTHSLKASLLLGVSLGVDLFYAICSTTFGVFVSSISFDCCRHWV